MVLTLAVGEGRRILTVLQGEFIILMLQIFFIEYRGELRLNIVL